jgi:uncharacterized delta-60 repeat protein
MKAIDRFKVLFAALILISASAAAHSQACVPASTAAGALDTCFGTNGKVTTDITNDRDFARALAIQPDGKIVVAGIAGYSTTAGNADFLTVRYNTDGSLDTSFDGDGIVVTDFSAWTVNDDDYCRGLAIQPDGKIIVAGRSFVSSPGTYALALIRYNPDGSLDTTFDGDGKAQFDMNAIIEMYAFALQPDGKILVGGRALSFSTGTFTGILARFNSNGSVDTSFGSNGSTTASITSIFSIALQPDGKIVAGGTNGVDSSASFAISRLNSNGSPDIFFGSGGVVTHHPTFSDQTWSVKIRYDNQIFITGHSSAIQGDSRGTLLRFGSDGTFGQSMIYPDERAFWNMTFQPDGKAVTVGLSFNPSNGFTVRRFTDVNVPDTSFNGGAVYVKFLPAATPETSSVNGIAMARDNKIVVAGSVTEENNTTTGWRLAITRLYSGLQPPLPTRFDFDGDGKADLSIFRPSNGEWWYLKSSNGGNAAFQFGTSSDKLVPADYTGDGKTDVAIWRPSNGEWFILRSEDNSYYSFPFGISGDIPSVGDFDADGKADSAVFRPSDTNWYIRRSSDGGTTIRQFGASGDVPVVSDYDGDGKADIAIWRASVGQWWIQKSSNLSVVAFQFGSSTDKPVQGDYTGDGKADVSIWRPKTGEWFILRSENQSYYSFPFGTNGDVPAPGDYDGDGRFDATVFRPSGSTWYVQRSTAGTLIQNFGIAGDVPVPNAFIP